MICTSSRDAYAQTGSEGKVIAGRIADFITNGEIPNMEMLNVELLQEDSMIVNSVIPKYSQGWKMPLFNVMAPKAGNYILRVSHPNYHTLYHPIKVKFYKRESYIDAGKLVIKRRRRVSEMQTLDEVTVTATRLKFYFDKDTLVYDASAFITQEGFMFNDILKKMPGITISPNGEIYSNGRKVETMLLNGKDFFNGDRETLLQNLPAFMIKELRIYDKQKDTTSTFLHERERKGLTMDVRLKREYNSSLLGNASAGYGTKNHYYGRLFLLKIHDRHRLSAYAGANDISKNEETSVNGQARNIDNGRGEKDFYNAGLNYNADDYDGKYTLAGQVRLQGSKELLSVREFKQSFYPSGDIFGLSYMETLSRNLSINTSHRFGIAQQKRWPISIQPAFSYIRRKNKAELLYAMFNRNVADSLRIHDISEMLRAYGINRMNVHEDKPVSQVSGSLSLGQRLKMAHSHDYMLFNANIRYHRESTESYVQRNTDYIQLHTQDWRNTYNKVLNENINWNADASYSCTFGKVAQSLSAKVGYEGGKRTSNDVLYNLHDLGNAWGSPSTTPPLGILPSEVDMLSTMNANNSKRFEQYDNKVFAQMNYDLNVGKYTVNVSVPLNIYHNKLNFYQDIPAPSSNGRMYSPTICHTVVRPDLNVGVNYKKEKRQSRTTYRLDYGLTNTLSPLIYRIEQRNDANPLMIYKGNPNLKDQRIQSLTAAGYWMPSMKHNHSLIARYTLLDNATSMSSLLDKETGKTIYTPTNVNGNWMAGLSLNSSAFLSKDYTNRIRNRLSFQYQKSVDYNRATADELSARSIVNNFSIDEEFTFSYSNKKRTISGELSPYIKYQRSTSTRQNFNDFHAFSFGLNISADIELPKNFRITTNAQSVSRRRYNSSEMNNDEIIWNATLSKAFKKGWKLSLEGTDLLGQYQNVTHYVNAQGRTESMYNHLGRYAMLHVTWQFNKVLHKPRVE